MIQFNVSGLAEYEENIQSIGLAYIYGGYFWLHGFCNRPPNSRKIRYFWEKPLVTTVTTVTTTFFPIIWLILMLSCYILYISSSVTREVISVTG